MRKLLILITLWCAMCFCNISMAAEMSDLDRADNAILQLVKVNPAHPLFKNAEARRNMAWAIVAAANKTEVAWPTLLGQAFVESSFRPNAVGKLGEVGLFQIKGTTVIQYCAEKLGRDPDLDNIQDQAYCGAYWMKKCLESSGGKLEGALSLYLTGNVLKPKPDSALEDKVIGRSRLIKKISEF